MESCTDEKKKFEDCFKKWYVNGLLKGEFSIQCEKEWNLYEQCLIKELSDKELLKLKDFSKPDEFKETNKKKLGIKKK